MNSETIEDLVKDINARLTRVEQFLPQLATEAKLAAAIAPLATKAELGAAIAPLATRVELEAAIDIAIQPLATRDEVAALRHEMKVLFEDVRDDSRIILEHLVALSVRVDALAQR